MKKSLHVICFDNPFPANYGGAIDMYYKLRELKSAGVYVILHVFTYGNKSLATNELSKIADKVHYYTRKTGILSNLSFLPYIVLSRKSNTLIHNLLKDNHPILFEGLHSCYYLNHSLLKKRLKLVRTHNIEHEYYSYLSRATTSTWKKIYYFIESLRLKKFEKNLVAADVIFSISSSDNRYFQLQFPNSKVELLPCFSNVATSQITPTDSTYQPYFLYHGNLAVSENQQAVNYLLDCVLPLIKADVVFKIAGNNPSPLLMEKVVGKKNIELIQSPSDSEMTSLISNAKANVLITFQPTGVKLKLINALFQGGFCIVNNEMLRGTDLDQLCIEANSAESIALAINKVVDKEFTIEDRNERMKDLTKLYSNAENVKVLLKVLEQ